MQAGAGAPEFQYEGHAFVNYALPTRAYKRRDDHLLRARTDNTPGKIPKASPAQPKGGAGLSSPPEKRLQAPHRTGYFQLSVSAPFAGRATGSVRTWLSGATGAGDALPAIKGDLRA